MCLRVGCVCVSSICRLLLTTHPLFLKWRYWSRLRRGREKGGKKLADIDGTMGAFFSASSVYYTESWWVITDDSYYNHLWPVKLPIPNQLEWTIKYKTATKLFVTRCLFCLFSSFTGVSSRNLWFIRVVIFSLLNALGPRCSRGKHRRVAIDNCHLLYEFIELDGRSEIAIYLTCEVVG